MGRDRIPTCHAQGIYKLTELDDNSVDAADPGSKSGNSSPGNL